MLEWQKSNGNTKYLGGIFAAIECSSDKISRRIRKVSGTGSCNPERQMTLIVKCRVLSSRGYLKSEHVFLIVLYCDRMFFKYFFVWLSPFGCLYYSRYFSAIKWSIFPSSLRLSRDSNPRRKTMARMLDRGFPKQNEWFPFIKLSWHIPFTNAFSSMRCTFLLLALIDSIKVIRGKRVGINRVLKHI